MDLPAGLTSPTPSESRLGQANPIFDRRHRSSSAFAAQLETYTTLTFFKIPKQGLRRAVDASKPLAYFGASGRDNSFSGTSSNDIKEQVRCYAITNDWLLPFVDRPSEIRALLFETPVNAHVAASLKRWADRHGQDGAKCLHTLITAERADISDSELIDDLRERIFGTAPDLWCQVSQVLGADAATGRIAKRPKGHDCCCDNVDSWYHNKNAVDDSASELCPVNSLPGQSSKRRNVVHDSWDCAQGEKPDAGIQLEGLFSLPQCYHQPLGQMDGPSFWEDIEDEVHTEDQEDNQSDDIRDADTSQKDRVPWPAVLSGLDASESSKHGNATPMAIGGRGVNTPRAMDLTPMVFRACTSDYFQVRPTELLESPRKPALSSTSAQRRHSVTLTLPTEQNSEVFGDRKVSSGNFACLRIRAGSSTWPKRSNSNYLQSSDFRESSAWPALSSSIFTTSRSSSRKTSRGSSHQSKPLVCEQHRRLSTLLPSQIVISTSTSSPLCKKLSSAWDAFAKLNSKRLMSDKSDSLNKAETDYPISISNSYVPAYQDLKRQKNLSHHRPRGASRIDDTELLYPQNRKFSFARSFEELTDMNFSVNKLRPKAYSTTQYSSTSEQKRLEMGLQGDIPPYEIAAALEAEGKEKPPSLGVLRDGRTRHPAAGVPNNSSTVASFRAALGLSPACSRRGSENQSRGSSAISSTGSSPVATPPNECQRRGSTGSGSRLAAKPSDINLRSPDLPSHEGFKPSADRLNWLTRRELLKLKPASELSGLAVGGKIQKSFEATTDPKSLSQSRPLPVLSSYQGTSPPVRRRPGGFSAYSKEWQAVRRHRARNRTVSDAPSSAISTGNQAVASSEGSTITDDETLLTPNEENWESSPSYPQKGGLSSLGSMGQITKDIDSIPPPAPSARRDGGLLAGDMGLDFGEGQHEHALPSLDEPQNSGMLMTPISPSPDRSPDLSEAAEPQRDQKSQSHLIFPVGPCGSRATALGKHLDSDRPRDKYRLIEAAIGVKAWNKAKRLLSSVERGELSDKELLECLATGCFGLVDLEAQDLRKREQAEDTICEDVEGYTKQWKAFVSLLVSMEVPGSSIAEAGRRCAPGEVLC